MQFAYFSQETNKFLKLSDFHDSECRAGFLEVPYKSPCLLPSEHFKTKFSILSNFQKLTNNMVQGTSENRVSFHLIFFILDTPSAKNMYSIT